MLVISPHLDDAVLSCADCLAAHPGTTVLTVFAGVPADESQRTDWDGRCGFSHAGEALAARMQEDRSALGVLGARPLWLGFVDAQYGEPAADEAITEAIAGVLSVQAPQPLLAPVGLFHDDHRQVHRAVVAALADAPPRPLYLYEDVPYRARPGLLQQRLAELHEHGRQLTPAALPAPPAPALKRLAVQAYASQWRGLGPASREDVWRTERYWRYDATARGGAA